MTPAQLLKQLEPKKEVPLDGIHYTSGTPDEDLGSAVELLLATPDFLHYLQLADNEHNILSAKARAELDNHLDNVEEFVGLWLND